MRNSSLNILLAEDNEDDVTLFRAAMDQAEVSANLRTVRDGNEVIAYLKGEEAFNDRTANPIPDVLLLDLNMPRCNGFEVLEWIRQDATYKRSLVYVLSASSRAVDIRRTYDLHANSYIVKPSRMKDLTAFITSLIGWHEYVCASPGA